MKWAQTSQNYFSMTKNLSSHKPFFGSMIPSKNSQHVRIHVSTCQFSRPARVVFLLFHVSFSQSSVYLFLIGPRILCLWVHTCQFRVPTCHFLGVPCIVSTKLHMSLADQSTFRHGTIASQNHFVTEHQMIQKNYVPESIPYVSYNKISSSHHHNQQTDYLELHIRTSHKHQRSRQQFHTHMIRDEKRYCRVP